MNAVRISGLSMALVNGLYSIYIIRQFRDDPRGAVPCEVGEASLFADLEAASGSTMSDDSEVQLVQTYTTFYILVVINFAAFLTGATHSMARAAVVRSG